MARDRLKIKAAHEPMVGQELPGHIPMSAWEPTSPPTQHMEPQSPAAIVLFSTQASLPLSLSSPGAQQCPFCPSFPEPDRGIRPLIVTQANTKGCLQPQMLTMYLTHFMIGPIFYVTGVTAIADQNP